MKLVEHLFNVTTRHKLTVTPEKITIRFAISSTEDENSRVETFFKKVSDQLETVEGVVRGTLAVYRETDTFYIVMKDDKKDISTRFFEGGPP